MLDDNRELIDRFNREEQKRQGLARRKRKRRSAFPKLSAWVHDALDRLDEKIERLAPVDCVSRKWVK